MAGVVSTNIAASQAEEKGSIPNLGDTPHYTK